MISKRLYLSMCEHIDIPFTQSEWKIVGMSTDETGRFLNTDKYLTEMKRQGQHVTNNQLFVMNVLKRLDEIRRSNKRG